MDAHKGYTLRMAEKRLGKVFSHYTEYLAYASASPNVCGVKVMVSIGDLRASNMFCAINKVSHPRVANAPSNTVFPFYYTCIARSLERDIPKDNLNIYNNQQLKHNAIWRTKICTAALAQSTI